MEKNFLQKFVADKFSDYKFVVVSNRQPYVHSFEKDQIISRRTPGGVVTALDPVLRACGGTWVAFANGDADSKVVGPDGKLVLYPDTTPYILKRVFLTKEEINGYYNGYSNETLWPLCHAAFKRPIFRQDDWEVYRAVNEKFALSVIEEIGNDKAFIWIQDYHLTLLPLYLRKLAKSPIFIAHFWHIPWPSYEIFRICPQKKEIIEGLLANDLLSFHIQYHCNNFIDCVEREMECKYDNERSSIIRRGHETMIRPYSISIDDKEIEKLLADNDFERTCEQLKKELRTDGKKIFVGVDRIDYTKGIPERLLAFERFIEKHPELKEKVIFIQVGAGSRIHVNTYKKINQEIDELVENINWKHATSDWKPIIFLRGQYSFKETMAYFRIADVGVVSSLHDGMNLVAKEFVVTCKGKKGVLVLSNFTGAARELTDAILINPYDREQFSEALYQAYSMPEGEQLTRLSRMQRIISENNVYTWAIKVLKAMEKFEFIRGGN